MDGSQIIFILATAMAIIVIVAAVYWYTKFYRTMIYKCPQCGYEGKPNVAKTLFSQKAAQVVKCPQCKSDMPMEPIKQHKD